MMFDLKLNDDSFLPLIGLLQSALNNPLTRSRLLQQPEKLREIMNDIPARRWLFEQTHQPDDPNPATDLIIAMMKSSRLLRHGGRISPDVYNEALSRTWVWFIEHLSVYKPEEASFVTWFNRSLGWRIQDVLREIADDSGNRQPLPANEEESERFFPPAPDLDRWHETVQEWLELVQNNPHLFTTCRMQNSPHINCHSLLIQLLKELYDSRDFSWNAIAQTFEVEPSTLRKFCRTRCCPRFKQLLSD